MFFILIALKDVKENLCSGLVSLKLNFFHGQEPHLDINVFIGLKAADHRGDREDLLGFLPYCEVVFNWVLATVLQVEILVLGLTNSDRFEVKCLVELHRLIQCDIECFRVQLQILVILLNAESLNIIDFQDYGLKELLL
jgi:hypothetical protein